MEILSKPRSDPSHSSEQSKKNGPKEKKRKNDEKGGPGCLVFYGVLCFVFVFVCVFCQIRRFFDVLTSKLPRRPYLGI